MIAWFQEMAIWIVGLAETPIGPAALFGLAVAEASFFPIPPDLLLLALDLLQPQRSFVFAAVCTAGSTIGGILGYCLGRWGGRPLLSRFVSENKIQYIERRFQDHDAWAIFIAGFTPIPYKVFAIGAGVFHLRFWRFVLVTIASRGLRFFLVSTTVFLVGERASRLVREYFNVFSIAFVVLLIGGFLVVKWAVDGSTRRSPHSS